MSVPRSCSVHSAIFLSLQSQPTATKVGSMKAEFSSADGQRSAAFDRQSVLIGRIGGSQALTGAQCERPASAGDFREF